MKKTKHNTKKHLVSLLLTLAMVMTILPAMSMTVFAVDSYIQIPTYRATGWYGEGTELYYWDNDTNTLILSDYTGRSFRIFNNDADSDEEVIVLLAGSSVITVDGWQCGIRTDGYIDKLTFTGDGDLTINSLTNQENRQAICLHRVDTTVPGQIYFSGSGKIEINMAETQADHLYGVSTIGGSIPDDSVISIGENAEVNINLSSNLNDEVWGLYTVGRYEIYGKLNITGTDTSGDSELAHTKWKGVYPSQSSRCIIGEYAHIKVDIPKGGSHGALDQAMLAVNDNTALGSDDWVTHSGALATDLYREYAAEGAYIKQYDSNGASTAMFADFLYEPHPVYIEPALTVTAPVVGQTGSNGVECPDAVTNNYLFISIVKWKKVNDYGTLYDWNIPFQAGDTYRAIVPLEIRKPCYIKNPTINGIAATCDNTNGSIYVDFGPLDSSLTFTHSAALDVPAGVVGNHMDSISLTSAVSGGKSPYSFSMVSGPDWLDVQRAGYLYATGGQRPTTESPATTAVIKATDAEESSRTITINVGAVRQPVVTFDLNGEGTNYTQSVTKGEVASRPEDPVSSDYIFRYWTYQNEPFDFTMPITDDITLKANWLLLSFDGDVPNVTTVVGNDATVSLASIHNDGKYKMVLEEKNDGVWSTCELLNYDGFDTTSFKIDRQTTKQTRTYRVLIADRIYTNEFTVSWTDSGEPLTYTGPNRAVDGGTFGYQIAGFNLNAEGFNVTGGSPPYTFSKVSGPDWLNISSNGNVTGIRPNTAQPATTAIVRITDDIGSSIDISIKVGAVLDTIKPPSFYPNTPGVNFTSDTLSIYIMPGDYNSYTYYTTDGSDPVTSPTKVPVAWQSSAQLSLSDTTTVKAYSRRDGYPDSPVVTATFSKVGSYTAPTASPTGGGVLRGSYVKLLPTMSDSSINYFMTTDGTEPAAPTVLGSEMAGIEYPTFIAGGAENPGFLMDYAPGTTVRIKAVSYKADLSFVSPVAEFEYTISNAVIETASIPNATSGQTYSMNFDSTDGVNVSWALDTDAPEWLSIDADTGVLSAPGTNLDAFASIPFTVLLKNAAGTETYDSRSYTLSVNAADAAAPGDIYLTGSDGVRRSIQTNPTGEGWSWDGKCGILTLDNFSGQCLEYNGTGALYLKLVGDNTLTFNGWNHPISFSEGATLALLADSAATLNVNNTDAQTSGVAYLNNLVVGENVTMNVGVQSNAYNTYAFSRPLALSGDGALNVTAKGTGNWVQCFNRSLMVSGGVTVEAKAIGTANGEIDGEPAALNVCGAYQEVETHGSGNVSIFAYGGKNACIAANYIQGNSSVITHTDGIVTLRTENYGAYADHYALDKTKYSNKTAVDKSKYYCNGEPYEDSVIYQAIPDNELPYVSTRAGGLMDDGSAEWPYSISLVRNVPMAALELTAYSGAPIYEWNIVGTLPDGLSFNGATGSSTATISGTPTADGVTTVQITATNKNGTSEIVYVKLTVSATVLALPSDSNLIYSGMVLSRKGITNDSWNLKVTGVTPASYEIDYDRTNAPFTVRNSSGSSFWVTAKATAELNDSDRITIIAKDNEGNELGRLKNIEVIIVRDAPLYIEIDDVTVDYPLTENAEGTGWHWDNATATLTLTDIACQRISASQGNLTVAYSGENTISGTNGDRIKIQDGTLTLRAADDDATLSLTGGSNSFYSYYNGKIIVEGGNVTMDKGALVTTSGGKGWTLKNVNSFTAYNDGESAQTNQAPTIEMSGNYCVAGSYNGEFYYVGRELPAPTVTLPSSKNVVVNESTTIAATVEMPDAIAFYDSGSQPLVDPEITYTYKWYKGDLLRSQNTQVATITSTDPPTGSEDAGAVGDTHDWTCEVTAAATGLGDSVGTSNPCTVKVTLTAGVTVSGTATSYGSDETEKTYVRLYSVHGDSMASEPAYEAEVAGIGDKAYSISAVTAGDYTVVVSKQNHAPREYEITVAVSDLTQDVQIYLYGDINGDGVVKATDRNILSKYLAHWPGYETLPVYEAVADINGDGAVKATDRNILSKYLAHWPGYESLD